MIETRAETGWKELTDRLRHFVSRRVGGADADDVVQDALLRVSRGLSELRDDERFGPWVYRVTRNAIADHHRARARPLEAERAVLDDDAVAAAPPEEGEERDLTEGLVGCLTAFVTQLPSPYREAITLVELEGLTHREAADMLGISLSGMKSRVQRGRDRLRRMFERCCELTQDARGRVVACDPRASC